jgi:hypothetical protein
MKRGNVMNHLQNLINNLLIKLKVKLDSLNDQCNVHNKLPSEKSHETGEDEGDNLTPKVGILFQLTSFSSMMLIRDLIDCKGITITSIGSPSLSLDKNILPSLEEDACINDQLINLSTELSDTIHGHYTKKEPNPKNVMYYFYLLSNCKGALFPVSIIVDIEYVFSLLALLNSYSMPDTKLGLEYMISELSKREMFEPIIEKFNTYREEHSVKPYDISNEGQEPDIEFFNFDINVFEKEFKKL